MELKNKKDRFFETAFFSAKFWDYFPNNNNSLQTTSVM